MNRRPRRRSRTSGSRSRPPRASTRTSRRRSTTCSSAGWRRIPARRFASAADLVAAMREALDEAAGRTAVLPGAAASERTAVTRVSPAGARGRRRNPWPVVLAVLGVLALAGVLAAALLAGGEGDETELPGHNRDRRRDDGAHRGSDSGAVGHARADARADAEPTPGPSRRSPAELNDQGFQLMQAGRYEEALPLLEQAVGGLAGLRRAHGGLRELQPRLRTLRARPLRRRPRATRAVGEDPGEPQGARGAEEGGRTTVQGRR